jgi:hypothetical protein
MLTLLLAAINNKRKGFAKDIPFQSRVAIKTDLLMKRILKSSC